MLTTQDSKPEWSFATEYLLFYTHWTLSCAHETIDPNTRCVCVCICSSLPLWAAACMRYQHVPSNQSSRLHTKLTSPRRHASRQRMVVLCNSHQTGKKAWIVVCGVCARALVATMVLDTLEGKQVCSTHQYRHRDDLSDQNCWHAHTDTNRWQRRSAHEEREKEWAAPTVCADDFDIVCDYEGNALWCCMWSLMYYS